MPKSRYASGSVSDVARKRVERLREETKREERARPKAGVPGGTRLRMSDDARQIKNRQEYEKIPEGNVRRKTGGK